jgi:hypothetical protein
MRKQIGYLRLVHGTTASAEIVSQGSEAAFEFCNTVVQFFAVEIFLDANLGDAEFDWLTIPSVALHSGFSSMLTTFESSEHELWDRVMSPAGHDLG